MFDLLSLGNTSDIILSAIRSELVISVERAHSPVADSDSCYHLLHRSLGSDAVGSNAFQ